MTNFALFYNFFKKIIGLVNNYEDMAAKFGVDSRSISNWCKFGFPSRQTVGIIDVFFKNDTNLIKQFLQFVESNGINISEHNINLNEINLSEFELFFYSFLTKERSVSTQKNTVGDKEYIGVTSSEYFIVNKKPPKSVTWVVNRKQTAELKAKIDLERIVFLCGIDGIGKTSFIKSFIEKYENEYDHIVYVPFYDSLTYIFSDDTAIEIKNMQRQYLNDGSLESDESYAKRKIAMIHKIATEKDLFIVDDFNQDDVLLDELVNLPVNFVFITHRTFNESNNVFKLPVLSKQETKQLFFHHYVRTDIECTDISLQKIFELIGYHTLTIIVLAKQMMLNRTTPTEMLNKFQNGILNNMEDLIRVSPFSSLKPAYKHINDLFNNFDLTDLEERLLVFLCIISPIKISFAFLKSWINSTFLAQTINNLNTYGLIELDETSDEISVHPIISEVLLYDKHINLSNYSEYLNNFLVFKNNFSIYTLPVEDKNTNAKIVRNILRYSDSIDKNLLPFYLKAERILSFTGFSTESLSISQEIEQIYTRSENDFGYLYILYCRGWTLFTQKKQYQEGLNIYKRVIILMDQFTPNTDNEKLILSDIYSDVGLAICRKEPKNIEKAIDLINKAILLYEDFSAFDVQSISLKISWLETFLSECYIVCNDSLNAEKHIKKAVKLHNMFSGKDDIYLSNILYRTSKIAKLNMNYQTAISDAEKAFKIYNNYYPYKTLTNVTHLKYIGSLYALANKYEESLKYYSNALSIAKELCEPKSTIINDIIIEIEKIYVEVDANEKNINNRRR